MCLAPKTTPTRCLTGFVFNAKIKACECPPGSIWDSSTLQCICELGTFNSLISSCDCPIGSVYDQASAACICVGSNVIQNGVCTPITTTTTTTTTTTKPAITTTTTATTTTVATTTEKCKKNFNFDFSWKHFNSSPVQR